MHSRNPFEATLSTYSRAERHRARWQQRVLHGYAVYLLLAILLAGIFTPLRAADSDAVRATAQSCPQWLRDGVIYEIFPRHFSVAGNFNGITARLDELKNLGVNILWLMPIHPIGTKFRKGDFGSPYSIRDYYAINPDYGTKDDFKKLIAEAHKRDLKVIMDIVANHTAWDSVMMAHPEFYKHDNNGKIIPPVPEWTDVAGLNYSSPQLRQYMLDMLKYWLKECDVDGFRCDVAYMVPTDFWEQARIELKKLKPDIMFLAEANKPELLNRAFDVDYSWPLLATLNNVLIHGASATDLRRTWEEDARQFPKGALHMRITDDHDEARAIARFGIRGALAASVLMFTIDGVPLLYNGMEAGDATESGDPALFDKLPIYWQPKERPPFRNIYRDLIKLRRQSSAFHNDRIIWLKNADEKNVVTFLREDVQDQFLIAINFANRPGAAAVEVAHASEFQPLKINGMPEPPAADFPALHLSSFEWRIYRRPLVYRSGAAETEALK
jgi:glycosidase